MAGSENLSHCSILHLNNNAPFQIVYDSAFEAKAPSLRCRPRFVLDNFENNLVDIFSKQSTTIVKMIIR